MNRTWHRIAPLALAALSLAACPPRDGTDDGGTDGGQDMGPDAGTCKADPLMVADFAVGPTGQKINPGDVGTPCTADTQCKQGPTPRCWKQTLLDKMGNLATPGGYCSSPCMKDTDCGPDNLCLDFGMPDGMHCVGGCGDAVTCRKPGYVCAYLDQVDNNILTGCWPNGNFDCNPAEPSCTDSRYGMPGGCVREAIEDENGGLCLQTCELNQGCDPDGFNRQLQCMYLDFTDGGDAFRGTICFPSASMPKDEGDSCMYSNECQDGYQCDNRMTGGSRKCEKLCNLKGRSPRCGAGKTCTKVFPGCEAGLCKAS